MMLPEIIAVAYLHRYSECRTAYLKQMIHSISVLESLVRKLKKLASNDDEIYKTIKNFEKNENEKELLQKCEKHQLITKLEYSRLDSIRHARNTYALEIMQI